MQGTSLGNIHKIKYCDEENEVKTIIVTNNQLERIIDELIKLGDYLKGETKC